MNIIFRDISEKPTNFDENKNPTASKLSPIDSKLNFTYKMFLK
jgi:hypothetical protein